MNVKTIVGVFIVLLAGGFLMGCIDTPQTEAVKVVVDQAAIDKAWNDGADWGYNEAMKEAQVVFDNRDLEWTALVEDRDLEWRQVVEEAYKVGVQDATYQTVTDISKIIGKLSMFGVI